MDAAGVASAHLFGSGTGTPGFAAFAARAPERVRSLALWGAYHAGYRGPGRADHIARWGRDYDHVEAAWFEDVIPNWGQGHSLRFFAPGLDSERLRRSIAMLERATAGPKMIQAISAAAWQADMRDVLPAIQAPTLVMASADSPQPVEHSRFAAELIPGATFEVLPASTEVATLADYFGFAVNAVERQVTDGFSAPSTDRILATVMFTDIVGSTELATRLGDERWRVLLDRHEQILRAHIEAAGGRLVNLTGDGSLSEFAGPARAIRCATAFGAAVGALEIEVRAGLHTGECERVGDDLAGLAVHIGARVSAHAGPGETWVSRTVRDLVAGSGIDLRERGTHTLKGVDGNWELFSVADATITPTNPEAITRQLSPTGSYSPPRGARPRSCVSWADSNASATPDSPSPARATPASAVRRQSTPSLPPGPRAAVRVPAPLSPTIRKSCYDVCRPRGCRLSRC